MLAQMESAHLAGSLDCWDVAINVTGNVGVSRAKMIHLISMMTIQSDFYGAAQGRKGRITMLYK